MIIAEYTLDHPALRETLGRVPGIEVTWEDSYSGPDGRLHVIAWVSCDDFDRLDEAIREDATTAELVLLTAAGGRRLYRFELVSDVTESSIMPVVVEVGGVHQELVADRHGWHNRTRFPDREAFYRVFQFCREHDIGFTFNRIYDRSTLPGVAAGGLTEAQHETLLEAEASGYLEIPREASLAELGARLGVSESSASERFRRGVKKLIQETIKE